MVKLRGKVGFLPPPRVTESDQLCLPYITLDVNRLVRNLGDY